jgi:hypothetical protein
VREIGQTDKWLFAINWRYEGESRIESTLSRAENELFRTYPRIAP